MKNIKSFSGEPLIHYTIRAAENSEHLDHVVVSTDDAEIMEKAEERGVDVVERPAELATDEASTIDAVLHVLEELDEEFDIVVLLQPTSPLRTSEDIDSAVEKFIKSDARSVVGVTEPQHPPHQAMEINDKGYLTPMFGGEYFDTRTQDLPHAYRPNGAVFVLTSDDLREEKDFYLSPVEPYVMPLERSMDIDTELDFFIAEKVMEGFVDES